MTLKTATANPARTIALDLGNCCICLFWDRVTDHSGKPLRGERGRCRRHAPRFSDARADGEMAVWPLTDLLDFCGEYVPTPIEEEQ